MYPESLRVNYKRTLDILKMSKTMHIVSGNKLK